MALQGTLDTFELPDVLRLLSSTRKSGRLRLDSDRGTGEVWLADGSVVGAEAGGAPGGDLAATLFEMLRAHEGTFAFEPGEPHPSPGEPDDVEALLAVAEERLVEWRDIEAVVPSLGAWVSLTPELPAPTVTVHADTWRLVATVGSGLTVGELGQLLGLGEIDVSRTVRDLVAAGLGVVTAAPIPEVVPERAAVSGPAESYEADDAYEAAEAPDADEVDEPAAPEPSSPFLAPAPAAWEEPAPPAPAPVPAADADEVARQLAMLSPRAAEAVAAAAASGSEEDRRAALETLDEEVDDEPVNRGLLLKFLGSVKT